MVLLKILATSMWPLVPTSSGADCKSENFMVDGKLLEIYLWLVHSELIALGSVWVSPSVCDSSNQHFL